MTATHALEAAPGRAYDVVAAARALTPTIRELAPVTEQQGQLPPELVEPMRKAGLFHLFVPEDYGGLEANPVTACKVIEEVSFADGSTGWCVMLAAQSGTFSGMLPREDARLIWGGGGIVAGTARPIGRALVTDQPVPGYRVSGRWPFASGSSHADWFDAECVVYDGDKPRRAADGNDVSRMCFIPRESVTIHRTWDTTGLRGSASDDFSCEDVFVPASRGFQILVDGPVHPWPLFRCLPLLFVTHGAQALGVARAAIEESTKIARAKTAWGTDRPLAEQPRLQLALAHAIALVESARTYLYAVTGELWDAVCREDSDTAGLRARVRLATSHAVEASTQAVDLVHAATGTSSIFRKSPLERHFRDIHTAAAHVMIAPLTFEAAGRVELGLEPGFPFF